MFQCHARRPPVGTCSVVLGTGDGVVYCQIHDRLVMLMLRYDLVCRPPEAAAANFESQLDGNDSVCTTAHAWPLETALATSLSSSWAMQVTCRPGPSKASPAAKSLPADSPCGQPHTAATIVAVCNTCRSETPSCSSWPLTQQAVHATQPSTRSTNQPLLVPAADS
jgi:hypothetical protein